MKSFLTCIAFLAIANSAAANCSNFSGKWSGKCTTTTLGASAVEVNEMKDFVITQKGCASIQLFADGASIKDMKIGDVTTLTKREKDAVSTYHASVQWWNVEAKSSLMINYIDTHSYKRGKINYTYRY